MNAKGAVICFQKYILGSAKPKGYQTPGGPVCFGYMGRVDVKRVDNFKDYVIIASQHGAQYVCTRKQLLIYQIDEKYDRAINLTDCEVSESLGCKDGKLPFSRASTGGTSSLCCCSVLSISQGLAGEADVHDVAEWLYTALEETKKTLDIDFAITGLLGAEDLCLILLSDHFPDLSGAVSMVQKLTHEVRSGKRVPVVDNSHSILMLDGSGGTGRCSWGCAHAEIFFSTKAASGFEYLNSVCDQMKEKWVQRGGKDEDISIEGCYGGYDTVIRCPAELLDTGLYSGTDGLISYDNPAYQNAVYQSETVVYPFGYSNGSTEIKMQQTKQQTDESEQQDHLDDVISAAIGQITRNILGTDQDTYQELTYIKLALYRLLKDYRRVTAYPLSAKLREDLIVQFSTAISAIVTASKSCQCRNTNRAVSQFNDVFNKIVNALNSAMWMVGQCDRLSFDEQSSYLQNIGSYHKVLLAYYGIIKDILRLLYSVGRNEENCQPVLVPVLSFSLTPIFNSSRYKAEYISGEKTVPAELLCIQLPYQALANPPKYLGILVHEVFHYLAPPLTSTWNQTFLKCVVRTAVCEFINLLARQAEGYGKQEDFGGYFQETYWNVVENVVQQITQALFLDNPGLSKSDLTDLREEVAEHLQLHRDPKADSYQFYFEIWKNLRKQFWVPKEERNTETDEEANHDAVLVYVFALDEKKTLGTEKLLELFSGRIRAVPDFYPLRYLLISCHNALAEVTADLFDVGIVLCGAERELWAKQFFWQIYSIRCDILHGTEGADSELPHAWLLTNDIRIGILMDFCLGLDPKSSDRVDRFAEYLKTWCRDRKNEERFARAQVTFRKDYGIYAKCGKLYTSQEAEFCGLVLSAQEGLKENSECAAIMEKFSGYYRRYYELLDRWQAETVEEPEMHSVLFDLCTEILEDYQCQKTIQEISDEFLWATPPKAALPRVGGAVRTRTREGRPPREYAEYPEGLSCAITSAYEQMAINGTVPMLWYRGQRNKHRETLPTIMRPRLSEDGLSFLSVYRQEIHMARTHILPEGAGFTRAEWLAFLQHNEFSTNVLDFSEEFYPALYFAIQRWIDSPKELPEYDSHIAMFNPVLFNLAMRALDEKDEQGGTGKAFEELSEYLVNGVVATGAYLKLPLLCGDEIGSTGQYEHYFAWDQDFPTDEQACRPTAALLPKNCERMKKQSGQYVFYDLRSKMREDSSGKKNYNSLSMENLHCEYVNLVRENHLPETPFLCEVNINRYAYKAFVGYAKAIGLRKYHVYPELDKLAKDMLQLLGF